MDGDIKVEIFQYFDQLLCELVFHFSPTFYGKIVLIALLFVHLKQVVDAANAFKDVLHGLEGVVELVLCGFHYQS